MTDKAPAARGPARAQPPGRARTGMIAALAALALSLPVTAAAGRFAALDLCGDQALVALVPAQQIAGLSPWARDRQVSAVADAAATLPALSTSAEAVLLSGADTVVTTPGGEGQTLALLQRLGIRIVSVAAAENFSEVLSSLRRTAAQLDNAQPDAPLSDAAQPDTAPHADPGARAPARAASLIAGLQARLDHLAATASGPQPLAAYYRPDGGTAGPGTAVDAVLTAAGYRNLAAALGKPGWTRFDLETLVLHPPDVIVTSFFDGHPWSLNSGFARHPVFRRMLAGSRVIDVPGRLWSCGGWPLVDAAEILATARQPQAIPARGEPSP